MELSPLPAGVYYLNNPDPEGRIFVYVVSGVGAIIDGPRPVDPSTVEREVAELRRAHQAAA